MEVMMPESGHPLLQDDRDLGDDDRDDRDESDDEIPESVQPTLTERTARLDAMQDHEPRHEQGHKQVVTTSSTNGRGTFHKQDPHADDVQAACSTVLRGDASEWVLKPKTAMERSSATACTDSACYGGGHDA